MDESQLTIVVPVFNEEQIIRETYRRIHNVVNQTPHEIIFVNDGSTDHTLEHLADIALKDPRVKVISLSRNFGHQLAVTAGLNYAKGDAVILMDADLQDPPEMIPQFMETWRQGYDVVYGIRRHRAGESPLKRFTAFAFYRLLRHLSEVDVPADVGDFRLMSRRIVDMLNNMPEQHRFIRGMVSWVGFRQIGIPYDRDSRFGGESKYPFHKMWRFSLDALTSFSVEPLRWVRRGALAVSGLAFLASIWLIRQKLAFPHSLVLGWTSTMVTMLWLGALQLGALGIIGEYLARVVEQGRQRPLYVVAQTINVDDDEKSMSPPYPGERRTDKRGHAVDFDRNSVL